MTTPAENAAAVREAREVLREYGWGRTQLDREAREAFVTLDAALDALQAQAARVEELERERDEQFSGRVQANRRARLMEAALREA